MAKIYIEVDDDYAFALQWLARAKRTTRPKLLASKIVEELDKLPGLWIVFGQIMSFGEILGRNENY